MIRLLIGIVLVTSVYGATLTIPIGTTSLPSRVVVTQGDTVTFVNVDHDSVHYVSSDELANFVTGYLYPTSFPATTIKPHEYSYTFDGIPFGDYEYHSDIFEKSKNMRGIITVAHYPCPWDNHPGFDGIKLSDGAVRPSYAAILPTRKNGLNQVTPPQEHMVAITVNFLGSDKEEKEARAGLENADDVIWSEPMMVRGKSSHVFEVDARSLVDGDLVMVVEVGGLVYHIPSTVVKNVAEVFTEDHGSKEWNVISVTE